MSEQRSPSTSNPKKRRRRVAAGNGEHEILFEYSEHRVVQHLGLNRDYVSARRKEFLARNRDWDVVGGAVRLSDEGLVALLDAMSVSLPRDAALRLRESTRVSLSEELASNSVEAVILTGTSNKFIAMVEVDGRVARLRVADCHALEMGSTVRAIQSPNEPDLYELAGRA